MSETPASSGLRNPDLLGIYCNDHLASATGGIELVARMLSTHKGDRFEERLEQLLSELREEKTAYLKIMSALDNPVRQYKQLGVWLAERSGFETLRIAADVEPRLPKDELDRLIDQAHRQYQWLTHTRREVAAEVFGGSVDAADRTGQA